MITRSDYQILLTRSKSRLSFSACDKFEGAIRLVDKHATECEVNTLQLGKIRQPLVRIHAVCNLDEARRADSKDAMGLKLHLDLKIGCRVMLTTNLSVPHGLVNGALGTVVAILYDPATSSSPPTLPGAVVVDFPGYSGPSFCDDQSTWVPVPAFNATWIHQNMHLSRMQIPLSLAFCITIHKSQGMTMDRAIVDIGRSEWTGGLSFVALYRLRTLNGLLLDPADSTSLQWRRWNNIGRKDGAKLRDRMNEDKRLRSLSNATDTRSLVRRQNRPSGRGNVRRGRH